MTEPVTAGSDAEPAPPLWQWSASRLAVAFRSGETTPSEALAACLARIADVGPRLNALVVPREQALTDARASTERHAAGHPLSPIDGLPLSIKDNLLTADQPTSWGSRGLVDHLPGLDELAVARARAAGAVLVGKTNVPEFTLEGYTSNPIYGTTRNPWDLRLTPGGSSGGAVAGIAAGMFPLALCTDGGGSVRRPASHCGLAGLKPSIGAIAREATLPSLLLDFEVVGPIARTVADLRLLFDAVRGPSDRDRASLACASAARLQPRPARPLRILYVAALSDSPVDPAIAASCRAAVEALAAAGHLVSHRELPLNLQTVIEGWPLVARIGLAAMFDAKPAWRVAASRPYREMAEDGARLPASRLWQLLDSVVALRADCAALFEEWDLVAMPSAAALPWSADEAFPPSIDGKPVGPRGHAVFTGWVNAAGLPAVSVPCDPAPQGLPIGLQLIGRYGADDAVLDAAAELEALLPWAGRWPPLR